MRLIDLAFYKAKKDLHLNWKKMIRDNDEIINATYMTIPNIDLYSNEYNKDVPKWDVAYLNKKIQDAGGFGTKSVSPRSWLDWGNKGSGTVGEIVVVRAGRDAFSVGFLDSKSTFYVYVLRGTNDGTVEVVKYLKHNVLGYRTSLD